MKKEKFLNPRKRKMLVVLPLLIIPFLTMAFWALGGGKAGAANDGGQSAGLNLQLPNAQLKDDKAGDKLSYYEQAEKDSVKWKEETQHDPFFSAALNDPAAEKPPGYDAYPLQTGAYKDSNEQKVYQKLAALNSRLQPPPSGEEQRQPSNTSFIANSPSINKTGEVAPLEEMMHHAASSSSKDPEVEQLNTMMDRILDIQHPERVKQRLSENPGNGKEAVFGTRRLKDRFTISLLDTNKTDLVEPPGFYGIDNEGGDRQGNAIEAVIHETQTLVDGSIVKMRLLNDIAVDSAVIPKGSFVFGKASLEGERLHIEINSIRKGSSLFAVKLQVFDLDGMRGVHIPGAITRDVAKQAADNSLQQIEMASVDPSLKGQAANAGIATVKALLSKKVKLVKVTVKAGYKILLKEISQ